MANIKSAARKEMTQAEYDSIQKRINKLEEDRNKILKGVCFTGKHSDAEEENVSILHEVTRLSDEIKKEKRKLENITIINNPEVKDGIVNINDIVKLSIDFGDEDTIDAIYKIIAGGTPSQNDLGIQEITIKSNLGKAIYQKEVGSTVPFPTNDDSKASAFIECALTEEKFKAQELENSSKVYSKK